MDLDRLDIYQVAKLSKVIELIGTPASTDDIGDCIGILEAAVTVYRRQLARVNETMRNHGE